MSQIQKYNLWKQHFEEMSKGDVLPNQGVVMVKGKKNSQVGMGLRLVAAAEEDSNIKRRKVIRRKQSSVRHPTRNIKKKTTKKPGKKYKKSKPKAKTSIKKTKTPTKKRITKRKR